MNSLDLDPPKTRETETLLANLNPMQKQACMALEGQVLILAGAGTGKTRVLTTRLANLIATQTAKPHEILAVTFTNKAASEMRERINRLLPNQNEQLAVGTFHSLSARFLRPLAEFVNLTPRFQILDPDDQIRLLRTILEQNGNDDSKNYSKIMLHLIDRWKNKAWTPDDVPESEKIPKLLSNDQDIYRLYQQRLQDNNAVDFGDLLLHLVSIWKQHPEILTQFHERFKYILVDEYQDTNVAQYLWLRLLTQKYHNICCVGDDDQAIYSWRGAEVTNILRFEKDYPEAQIIRLETNYRSTGHILNLASTLISHNRKRMGKTLHSRDEMGEKVRLCQLFSGDEEARYVAGEIDSLAQTKKILLDEMAILVRTGAQTRAFEEALLNTGLPYQIIGGLRFYEREEIRDITAYLRLIARSEDDLALERIINKPTRGIGATTVQTLKQAAARAKMPVFSWLEQQIQTPDETFSKLQSRTQNACSNFVEFIRKQKTAESEIALSLLTENIITDSGYLEMVQKNPEKIKRDTKLENLRELPAAQSRMQSLDEFLEHIALIMDADRQFDHAVMLMTIHAAKGLEFDTVFLPGWEEGLFPSQRTIDETGLNGLEEERRLAYVALTRAKRRAYVLYTGGRRLYGQWQAALPSRFLRELPPESLEIINAY